MKNSRLIQAMQNDTAVLTSAVEWLEEEREKVKESLTNIFLSVDEFRRLQGQALAIRSLQESLKREARVKDGAEADKSGTGRNGRAIPRGL